jgi:CHAD domain-containing protein
LRCLQLNNIMVDQGPYTPPDSLAHLARGVFAELHHAIITQEEGVLSLDVEAVHDMRVACRRMRVALSNFAVCCDPEGRRRMRALLNKLADALGEVRDLDVLLAALKKYKKSLPPGERRHLADLIGRLRARRLRRCRRLKEFLRGADYAAIKRDFLPTLLPAPTTLLQLPQLDDQEEYGQALQSKESVA